MANNTPDQKPTEKPPAQNPPTQPKQPLQTRPMPKTPRYCPACGRG